MKSCLILVFSVVCATLFAQKPIELPLWPDGVPTVSGLSGEEKRLDAGRVSNVTQPTITVHRPKRPNGTAIIMCPGGGYALLAMAHEGNDMAQWLNAQGITYVVLKYRIPNGHSEIPLSDAEQAIRMVRNHAGEWNINPRRIGIMGASAGGHLAASLATLYGSEETRPDFQILFYPVISMQEGVTHEGSRRNLLGDSPENALIERFTLEKQVNGRTPQAFIMLSSNDKTVPPANSIGYYEALCRHKVPVTLHAYPTGGHGWGFRDSFVYKRQWTEELEKWIREELDFDE